MFHWHPSYQCSAREIGCQTSQCHCHDCPILSEHVAAGRGNHAADSSTGTVSLIHVACAEPMHPLPHRIAGFNISLDLTALELSHWTPLAPIAVPKFIAGKLVLLACMPELLATVPKQ